MATAYDRDDTIRHHTQKATTKQVSISSYFDGLKIKAAKKAQQLVLERANKMEQILTFRKNLGQGWGRFPRWDGSGGKKSNRSFSKWRVQRASAGVYNLTNRAVSKDTWSWAYPKNLTNGVGWSAVIKRSDIGGPNSKLVRGGYGMIFSSQMPQGLMPWLRHQRGLLKEDIKKSFGGKK